MPAVITYKVKCPCCETILVIDKVTGEILEHRAPLVENPSGDRFADALSAQKDRSKKLNNLFDESLSGVKEKETERQSIFEESLKKARDEGPNDDKPIRDIDLD